MQDVMGTSWESEDPPAAGWGAQRMLHANASELGGNRAGTSGALSD